MKKIHDAQDRMDHMVSYLAAISSLFFMYTVVLNNVQ